MVKIPNAEIVRKDFSTEAFFLLRLKCHPELARPEQKTIRSDCLLSAGQKSILVGKIRGCARPKISYFVPPKYRERNGR
jgi:hypothetical protein